MIAPRYEKNRTAVQIRAILSKITMVENMTKMKGKAFLEINACHATSNQR